jgi:hypothetical protein
MQEQLPHGLLESASSSQASEGIFLGLLAVLDAETQGCPGEKVPLPGQWIRPKDYERERQKEGKGCRRCLSTRQDAPRLAMAILWVSVGVDQSS